MNFFGRWALWEGCGFWGMFGDSLRESAEKIAGKISPNYEMLQILSVTTPAEPRGEKKKIVQTLGGENLLKFVESAGEISLSGLRGAPIVSNTFQIVFRIFFRCAPNVTAPNVAGGVTTEFRVWSP